MIIYEYDEKCYLWKKFKKEKYEKLKTSKKYKKNWHTADSFDTIWFKGFSSYQTQSTAHTHTYVSHNMDTCCKISTNS